MSKKKFLVKVQFIQTYEVMVEVEEQEEYTTANYIHDAQTIALDNIYSDVYLEYTKSVDQLRIYHVDEDNNNTIISFVAPNGIINILNRVEDLQ